MKNALHVLGRDLLRLIKTPGALVVVIVLVVLPSLYTWFNVIGFWNPYNNTGNMHVCVVNEDAGDTNELLGQMNLGDQIVDQLHDNDQLDWDFVSLDEAMDQVNSGDAYAAFVIPNDFTSKLMTILSGDFQQPNIQYYVNEKINPVSPKVTDAGSTTLDETINSEFVSTVSETVAEALNNKIEQAEDELGAAQSDVAGDLNEAADGVASIRSLVSDLVDEASAAQEKTNEAKSQLQNAYDEADKLQDQLQKVADSSTDLQNSIGAFTAKVVPQLNKVNSSLSTASNESAQAISKEASKIAASQSTVDAAVNMGNTLADSNDLIITRLNDLLERIQADEDRRHDNGSDGKDGGDNTGGSDSGDTGDSGDTSDSGDDSNNAGNTGDNNDINGDNNGNGDSGDNTSDGDNDSKTDEGDSSNKNNAEGSDSADGDSPDIVNDAKDDINDALDGVEDSMKQKLQAVIGVLTQSNNDLKDTLADTEAIAKNLEVLSGDVTDAANDANTQMQGVLQKASGYQDALFSQALPQLSNNVNQAASAAISLKATIANQTTLIDQMDNILSQLHTTLGTASSSLGKTDELLATLETKLQTASSDVATLGLSTTINSLIDTGAIDPEKIAEFMQSPTEVTTEKLYPLNAYGSAMAPLFISLSLWIGCIMLCVILKLEVDNEKIPGLTVAQGWIGRWLFFAILVILQAIVCVAGCLYIGVQTVSVPAFFATAICLSLSYLTIVYTLSSSFQHIGIGLCIILVFVQIPGGTGLYPVEMTPDFFHAVYPIFPFTYGINSLRECIAGFYGNHLGQYLGTLLAIGGITGIVGLFLRPQLTNFNRLIARELQENDLVNVEEALVPERKFRLRQLISALSNHEDFHAGIRAGEQRFMRVYPWLKIGALIAGVFVPVISTTVLVLNESEKVVILTLWLIWLVFVIVFLLAVEYIRAHIQRKADIDSMSDEELYEQLSARRKGALSRLISGEAKQGDDHA